ncbi:pyrroline-5-carboxylate reductase [Corynebacterium breve]|uniref:Pyrroline-5-carboxylate reductase n=1 Tax=Corynebacterium breve TaxID=3049799 RepID=A0ABY8VED6_9CORY|nr:pyrroline-5-carboxylate reductase [Corynebacterium breve]WIM68010.1 pyrroline-5-carboxylate reductase [Corynebacterium breve]
MSKISVIGGGQIGEALIAGLIAADYDPKTITVTNRSAEHSEQLAQRYGVHTTSDNEEAASDADVVFLCVKPAGIVPVIEEIADTIANNDVSTTLVSMAAGITLAKMEEAISSAGTSVVRVMPNTPMLIGKGVCAISTGKFVTEEQAELVKTLLASTGTVVFVPEGSMDAVTALSGSGPAYVFLVTEALIDAAVSLGLSRSVAQELAIATVAGSGAMLEQSGADPVVLRAGVSSPAGTTVAAVRELEESGLRGAFYRALEKNAFRARELGKQ